MSSLPKGSRSIKHGEPCVAVAFNFKSDVNAMLNSLLFRVRTQVYFAKWVLAVLFVSQNFSYLNAPVCATPSVMKVSKRNSVLGLTPIGKLRIEMPVVPPFVKILRKEYKDAGAEQHNFLVLEDARRKGDLGQNATATQMPSVHRPQYGDLEVGFEYPTGEGFQEYTDYYVMEGNETSSAAVPKAELPTLPTEKTPDPENSDPDTFDLPEIVPPVASNPRNLEHNLEETQPNGDVPSGASGLEQTGILSQNSTDENSDFLSDTTDESVTDGSPDLSLDDTTDQAEADENPDFPLDTDDETATNHNRDFLLDETDEIPANKSPTLALNTTDETATDENPDFHLDNADATEPSENPDPSLDTTDETAVNENPDFPLDDTTGESATSDAIDPTTIEKYPENTSFEQIPDIPEPTSSTTETPLSPSSRAPKLLFENFEPPPTNKTEPTDATSSSATVNEDSSSRTTFVPFADELPGPWPTFPSDIVADLPEIFPKETEPNWRPSGDNFDTVNWSPGDSSDTVTLPITPQKPKTVPSMGGGLFMTILKVAREKTKLINATFTQLASVLLGFPQPRNPSSQNKHFH